MGWIALRDAMLSRPHMAVPDYMMSRMADGGIARTILRNARLRSAGRTIEEMSRDEHGRRMGERFDAGHWWRRDPEGRETMFGTEADEGYRRKLDEIQRMAVEMAKERRILGRASGGPVTIDEAARARGDGFMPHAAGFPHMDDGGQVPSYSFYLSKVAQPGMGDDELRSDYRRYAREFTRAQAPAGLVDVDRAPLGAIRDGMRALDYREAHPWARDASANEVMSALRYPTPRHYEQAVERRDARRAAERRRLMQEAEAFPGGLGAKAESEAYNKWLAELGFLGASTVGGYGLGARAGMKLLDLAARRGSQRMSDIGRGLAGEIPGIPNPMLGRVNRNVLHTLDAIDPMTGRRALSSLPGVFGIGAAANLPIDLFAPEDD
jgi:RimJ/RimL family protein N-acetyltransferase